MARLNAFGQEPMPDARPAAVPALHAPQEAWRNVPPPAARHEPQVAAHGRPVVKAAGWLRPGAAPDDKPAARSTAAARVVPDAW
jgi:hypothetical protein